jgi:MATE family multidrug resistance protein
MGTLAFTNLKKVFTKPTWDIVSLSLPIMSISLSNSLMIVLDRIIISHYSIEAMNAIAAAASAIAPLSFSAWSVASIAEVFVGQTHGAKKHDKVAQPVWQMVWFSLFLGLLFIPIGIWAGPYVLTDSFAKEGLSYYQLMMSTGFLLPLNVALASFFVGRGKVKIITMTAIAGNLVNLCLDLILIFGVAGILEPMGTKGAAIATITGLLTQTVTLGTLFLRSSDHQNMRNVCKLCWKTLRECISIGGPNAINYLVDMTAWYILFIIADRMGTCHVTILQIGYSLYTLFYFFPEGLQKGVMILSSNAIGQGSPPKIPQILRSSFSTHVLIMFFLTLPLLIFPSHFIKLFLGSELDPLAMENIVHHSYTTLVWLWFYFFLESTSLMLIGVLTAAGDTKFIMKMCLINVWIFLIFPICIFFFFLQQHPGNIWAFLACYSLINFSLFYRRYRKGQWKALIIKSLSSRH